MTPDTGMELVEILARAICEELFTGPDEGCAPYAHPLSLEDARERMKARALKGITAIEASGRWKLVPVEPTEEMKAVAPRWIAGDPSEIEWAKEAGGELYKAMLSKTGGGG